MGRGISELQAQILCFLLDNGEMLRVRDLLSQLWGPAGENGAHFSRTTVGAEGYDQIHATLSRSCERLRLRGLTRTFKDVAGTAGTIISLTVDGVAMAKEIMEAEEEPEPDQP